MADSLWQGEEAEEGVRWIARAGPQKVRKSAVAGWAGAGRRPDCLGTHLVFLKEQSLLEAGRVGPSDPPSPSPSRSLRWTHRGVAGESR